MEIYRDIRQGTTEWRDLRLGMLTASHAQAIATGAKGLDTLCRKLAYERYTGHIEQGYKSEAMQLGNDEEDYARTIYEFETSNIVTQVGFVKYNDFVGFSPDGLCEDISRTIEIKRQNMERHGDIISGNADFDSGYIWQVQMGLLIMGWEYGDLMSYNPYFRDKSLFIREVKLTGESKDKLLKGFKIGEELIMGHLERLMT